MPNQTVTIEIDVPDGYECCEYRRVKEGEICMTPRGIVFEWPGGVRANDANYFILREIEPEKPQLRCFEIDWTADLWPCVCNGYRAANGMLVNGYRIVGFNSNPDNPTHHYVDSCRYTFGEFVKHTHAVGVLDEPEPELEPEEDADWCSFCRSPLTLCQC